VTLADHSAPMQGESTHSDLTIKPVNDKTVLRRFIRMTLDVYKDDPFFVQPREFEVSSRLDANANPLLKRCKHQLWIAERNGHIVGRIGAIINGAYIEKHGEKCGHFGYFEAIDDAAVIDRLFMTAEDWFQSQGMDKASGPYNFSVNEECGLLVDGFDRAPAVMMPHGRAYYASHLERLGYRKATDMLALWYPARHNFMPERRRQFVNKLVNKPHIEVRNFDFSRYTSEIETAVDVFNDAWANNWGFVPLAPEEARHLASELRPVIARYNTVMCSVNGEPAAFGIVLPNVNELIADFDGNLLPFNWAKLIYRLKIRKPTTARMPLMGIRQKYQGKPLGAAFAYKIIDMVNTANVNHGIVNAELSWILEQNEAMLNMLTDIGGVPDKRYRIYEKIL